MSSAAKVWQGSIKVFVVCSVLLSACTGTFPAAIDMEGRDPNQADTSASISDSDINLTEHFDFGAASSRKLLDVRQGIGIELLEGPDLNRIVVDTGGQETDYTVTKLPEPTRIVIDLHDYRMRSNQVVDLADAALITQIRLGSHPDKSRIVLDLRDNLDVAHKVEALDGKLSITLARNGGHEPLPTNSAGADLDAPKSSSADQATLPAEAARADDQLKPRLMALRLDRESEGDLLVAEMESAGFFTLRRTAPSEYVLQLENADLDPTVTRSLMATAESGAIRTVRPVVEGNDVLVRIFVDPKVDLKAEPRGGSIVVSEQKITSEMRAQADLDQLSTPAAAAEPVNDDIDAEVGELLAEGPRYTGRLISLDLQDTDIDNALRIIAEVSNLNIIASDDVTGKVTLRLIDVPWDQALDVILKTHGLDQVQERNVIRIAPVDKLRSEREALRQSRQAEDELEPLQVMYRRISYAKASELKPLIESVLTERGTVTYDDRTNQAIIRDIKRGLKNATELMNKLDLRTPQVLLETQIVEANRSIMRDLGSELGLSFIQSPETGNATGYNFPNSIQVTGSGLSDGSNVLSSFPAAAGSGISFLFDSADGSKQLAARISGLESEGRIRVVSRPAVVTTNNRQAVIESTEKIRIRLPSSGLSVATGQGAQASGSGSTATEEVKVGITLEVTPQASPDYFVLLDINAKSSSFGAREVDGIPSEIERSATSTVLVSSGQTFAMGGIYRIVDSDAVTGVPFFKDIPVIGHLFRGMKIDKSDEELLFFITPRIVEGSFDDAAMEVQS